MGRERRPHIGIFGRRNNGKSTLINFLAGQNIAIVSDVAGTTTDPVKKSFEITGFGPVILIDTAGIDDTGELGEKRITKTNQIIKIIDLAVLVITQNTFGDFELGLIDNFNKQKIQQDSIAENKKRHPPIEDAILVNIVLSLPNSIN